MPDKDGVVVVCVCMCVCFLKRLRGLELSHISDLAIRQGEFFFSTTVGCYIKVFSVFLPIFFPAPSFGCLFLMLPEEALPNVKLCTYHPLTGSSPGGAVGDETYRRDAAPLESWEDITLLVLGHCPSEALQSWGSLLKSQHYSSKIIQLSLLAKKVGFFSKNGITHAQPAKWTLVFK